MSDLEDLSSSESEFSDCFLTSSNDEDDRRERKPKNEKYIEQTVASYGEEDFVEHFRVKREIAIYLSQQLQNSQYYFHQAGEHGKLTSYEYVLVFLWYAGHEAIGFRDVADRFDISLSTLHKIIYRMTYFISNMSYQIIKWPSEEEKPIIEENFRRKGFPGVLGIIDGTHIRIDKPSEDPDSYYNRKSFFSFQAQVVCDHRRFIRDVFVGFPGSVHDSRVLRASPLFETLEEKCQNNYILGDSGYPCLKNLLTPFRDRGDLTRRQQNFNRKLSGTRYVIEHCFGILKQKYRQLYHLKMRKIEDMVHFFRACCVLHNLNIDDLDDIVEINENEEENQQRNALAADADEGRDDGAGIRRRNEVLNILRMD
ncbi:hypothetical protein ABEB36_003805 [Hypothenemus hampei]|uniref:Putative nuclease HARBI1 n=1 Tax=Hypothenemus hampei TaxID=57062 RepID=A0ABD1F188_HYPHA